MKLYVASSWRNRWQPSVVKMLRTDGHEVYDFRHPKPDDHGFSWGDIAEDWRDWTPKRYVELLDSPIAETGFASDIKALDWAEGCVLVLPCGRSSHLELGYAVGKGKHTAILLAAEEFQPELMYRMVDVLTTDARELLRGVRQWSFQKVSS